MPAVIAGYAEPADPDLLSDATHSQGRIDENSYRRIFVVSDPDRHPGRERFGGVVTLEVPHVR
jgi:hypothetical protein